MLLRVPPGPSREFISADSGIETHPRISISRPSSRVYPSSPRSRSCWTAPVNNRWGEKLDGGWRWLWIILVNRENTLKVSVGSFWWQMREGSMVLIVQRDFSGSGWNVICVLWDTGCFSLNFRVWIMCDVSSKESCNYCRRIWIGFSLNLGCIRAKIRIKMWSTVIYIYRGSISTDLLIY